jgi:BirA family transcriptional regulator, biotin operon repressor / biotin---[acetyl-CoA-carboxylase] ligase
MMMSDSPNGAARPADFPDADGAPAGAMVWQAEALWAQLLPLLPGLSVEVVARIPSTNSALLERSRASASQTLEGGSGGAEWAQVRRSAESTAFGRRSVDSQPCLLVAEHQTSGRGRQGRPWQAVPGASLTFSLALSLEPRDWSGLSLAVGVALAEALDPEPGLPDGAPRIGLKWPNDLWLMDAASGAGRKLGGILIETVNAAPGKRLAVIGVGLNVLPLYPSDAKTGVACLQEINPLATPPLALATVALPLVRALQQFEREGFDAFEERFAARDILLGRQVHTNHAAARTGIAQGVGRDGALRVATEDGQVHAIGSGEVSVRLDPPGPDSAFGALSL